MVLVANRKGIRPHFLMRRVLTCQRSHASYLPSNDLPPRYQGVSLLTNRQRTTWSSSYHFASSSSSSFVFLYSSAILLNLFSLLIVDSPLHVLRNFCSRLILEYLVIFVRHTNCQSMFGAWNVPDAYLSILYEWSHNIFITGLLRLKWSLHTLKMGGERESWRSICFVLRTKPGFTSKQLSMNHQVLSPLKKDLVFNRPWLSLSYLLSAAMDGSLYTPPQTIVPPGLTLWFLCVSILLPCWAHWFPRKYQQILLFIFHSDISWAPSVYYILITSHHTCP